MTLTGQTTVTGVMGWPVKHSRSPRLHNHWLGHLGIDGVYVPFPVKPDQVRAAVQALPALGIRGVNLTVPHKELVMEVCDDLTDAAKAIGAANTIAVTEDGALVGDNTDAFGFLEHLKQAAPQWQPDRMAIVLGAGGAARAAVYALMSAGVPDVRVINRTESRAHDLAQHFGPGVSTARWEDTATSMGDAGLLVNTTTLGMDGQPPLDLDLGPLPQQAVVYDIVYAPLETDLLASARARGLAAVDGLGMLIYQAVPAFERWFGVRPPVDDHLRKLMAAP